MKPKVTIIVPVYKAEAYIDRCIISLVNQSLKEIEILLIDDGSPDNCPKICDDWAKKDSRIRVIHKNNEGLGLTRNIGIDHATGEYFTFLDSDDWVELDMYDNLYEFAKRHNLQVSYSRGLIHIDEKGNEIKKRLGPKEERLYLSKELCKRLGISCISSPTKSICEARDISVNIGLFQLDFVREHNLKFVSEREYISEDLIFDVDLFNKTSRVGILPISYYYYYNNTSSLSKSYRRDRFEKIVIMYYALEKRLLSFGYNKRERAVCSKYITGMTREVLYSSLKHSNIDSLTLASEIASKHELWKKVSNKELYKIIDNKLFIFVILLRIGIPQLIFLYCWIVLKGFSSLKKYKNEDSSTNLFS